MNWPLITLLAIYGGACTFFGICIGIVIISIWKAGKKEKYFTGI
jgi:hypothetical protein